MVKMPKKNCTSSTITICHVSCTLHGIRLDQLPHLGKKAWFLLVRLSCFLCLHWCSSVQEFFGLLHLSCMAMSEPWTKFCTVIFCVKGNASCEIQLLLSFYTDLRFELCLCLHLVFFCVKTCVSHLLKLQLLYSGISACGEQRSKCISRSSVLTRGFIGWVGEV
jgi:hypothetical protein